MLSSLASADTVTGQVNITGSVGVSATTIDFYSGNTPGPGTTGSFVVGNPVTGDFSSLVGTTGAISDLVGPPYGSATPNFLTFSNGITFNLDNFPAGTGGTAGCSGAAATAVGSTCTPIINGNVSPFTIANGGLTDASGNASAATITLFGNLTGYMADPAGGTTPVQGVFSTPQATNGNIADILATINGGGFVSTTYAANFTTVAAPPPNVPEPTSLLLLGGGLIGLAALKLRKSS